MSRAVTNSRATPQDPAPESRPARKPRRRTVAAATAASAVLLPLSSGLLSAQPGGGPAFLHGVASGDPLPDGVLLWTRVTPSPEAVPGSGKGAPVEVTWEVAEDEEFSTVAARGTAKTRARTDHTVKADVRGLRPDTTYWFRFSAGTVRSPAGRTRTTSAENAAVGNLRFGVVSCSHYEAGYFAAYRHLASRTDLDAVLHLGDYIYECATGEYPVTGKIVRKAQPEHETVTLADYRVRHAHYKLDPDLQALHAAHPVVAMWDDHEFANNAWSKDAENHTSAVEASPGTAGAGAGAEGDWAGRVRAAKQAYFEWMPVRPSTEGTTYRRIRFGRLADLHMLDLRSFRDHQPRRILGHHVADDPDRTITGRAQLDWLKSGLSGSTAQWRMVGTSVMIASLAFDAVPTDTLRSLAKLLGLTLTLDQWDGYTDDRRELLTHIRDNRIANTVFLAGDIHMAFANDVPLRAAGPSQPSPVATEFVVASVTSPNLDDISLVPSVDVSSRARTDIRRSNPHVRWLDTDSHGFGVLDVDTERVQMDYFVLSDKTDRHATAEVRSSYRTRSGTQRLEKADAPVRT
ncbi:alkaline phosphatase [Streptomyces abyssalis]|uniref:Alkaline phosphatase n=1 Tax=Streptomyces abyssalis TaxID=933944 RepID=A0A1E7JSZ1_9ACTN|nr:alkaline phosphatase [Streptomyces abyssalis]OEU94710.1 alkaline phosphatase [Streptomyces abyssalis]